MPVTNILPEKIKEKSYLLYKIQQKHARWNTAKSALLIGAGCSHPILPLGGGLIQICQELCFVRTQDPVGAARIIDEFLRTGNTDRLVEAVGARGEDALKKYVGDKEAALLDRLRRDKSEISKLPAGVKWEDFEACVLADARYGFWMDEYDKSPRERQRFVEALIESKNPGGAYIVLAYLIELGFFSNILTSNFDDFINDSLLYYTGTKPRFYADDELSQFISIYSLKPNIIKLHGDYRYANIKNTNDETKRLSERLENKLRDMLTELDLIVIGYNGADFSIMKVLQQVKGPNCELLWCGLDENNVHWRVANLINNTENSHFIKIKGFDDLMGDFYLEFLKAPPGDLVEKARKRQTEIGEYVKQFSRGLKDKADTPEEKDRLEKQEEMWKLWTEANEKKEWNLQIDVLDKILAIDDRSVKAYYRRAYAYIGKDEYQKAIDDCNKAIALDDKSPTAYNNRGFAYCKINQFDKGLEDYNRAIELQKDNAVFLANRGDLYTDMRQFDKAIDDITRAIELNPSSATYYNSRGVAYYRWGQYQKAVEDYSKAIELDPDPDPVYYINRGDAYANLKDMDKANVDYEKAKELKEKVKAP